jgi:hypothetical protein
MPTGGARLRPQQPVERRLRCAGRRPQRKALSMNPEITGAKYALGAANRRNGTATVLSAEASM